jgi:hypothetical protein
MTRERIAWRGWLGGAARLAASSDRVEPDLGRVPRRQTATPTIERRAFPRHQLNRNGKIILADESCYIDCAIKNISEGGALVTMQVSIPLPSSVFLWDAKTGIIYDCNVQWRKQNMVGLRFTGLCGRAMRRILFEKYALRESDRTEHALRLYPTPTRWETSP